MVSFAKRLQLCMFDGCYIECWVSGFSEAKILVYMQKKHNLVADVPILGKLDIRYGFSITDETIWACT